jgi:hypothetical protein
MSHLFTERLRRDKQFNFKVMKELTKEQKLKLLNEILEHYIGEYICIKIAYKALYADLILPEEFFYNYYGDIAVALIPEMLQIKPEIKEINGFWFGRQFEPESNKLRKEKIKELIKIIENK